MEVVRLDRFPARTWTWPRLNLSTQSLISVLLLLLIANLVVAPLVMVVATAVNLGPTARTAEFSLDYFRQAWTSPSTWAVLGNTAVFALGSTTLAMLIGV